MLAILGGTPVRSQPFTPWPVFGEAEEMRLLRTLRSGKWGRLHGEEVAEFEQRFAAMHGCRHGIAVVNGTVSLRIALLAAGIRAEDEVIVPPYTFISTASAVIEANAIPVFADVDLHTFNLDPAAVERALTPAHQGHHPGPLRRSAGRYGGADGDRARPRAGRDRRCGARARGELPRAVPRARSATWPRSPSSRART